MLVLENQLLSCCDEGLKIKRVIGVMQNHAQDIDAVALTKIKVITEQDLKFPLLNKLVQEVIFFLELLLEDFSISAIDARIRHGCSELVDGYLPGY